ncbi:acyl-CoA acyltransferase [Prosthecodimorpha staleyi]|uniref:Acyl-CoA acyltransferase n=1 Tax=Prosthecodimorpha staleyi TaxID=2840188 RepID=A0A947D4T0_9HYPH|nr:acyl-CoA acyltransferase [Prosthecodimorpha staleyi]MBT9290333.1 acyl-CoA acyltransferase [Prosthecodimorpha staleyi]
MEKQSTTDTRVRCRPIGDADIEAVADLLARGFAPRPRAYFLDGLRRQGSRAVPDGLPRYGYLLETGGVPVGAVLLIFTGRSGEAGPRCNIASWYVDPPYRGHAAMLSSMALRNKQATYLNVTPAPSTWPILEAQGYRRYCSGLFAAVPLLSTNGAGRRVETVAPGAAAVDGLDEAEARLLGDHAGYGCLSLVVRGAPGPSPFVFLPFRMRSGRIPLPVMQLAYCRSVEDFVAAAAPLGRALARRGRFAVLIDALGPVPGLAGFYTERRGRKYVKGPGEARLADLTDTELVLFGP